MSDRTVISAISIVLLCAAGPVRAAGFDCDKATSPVETTICHDSKLSKLDADLTATYAAALATSGSPDWLRTEQRTWIAKRNACNASDTACLEQRYRGRLEVLRAQIDSPLFSFRGFSPTAEAATLWNFIAADARLGSYPANGLVGQRDRFSFARVGLDSYVLWAEGFYVAEPGRGTFELLTPTWPADAVAPVKFLPGRDGSLWALLHVEQLTHGISRQDFGALLIAHPGSADVAVKYVDIASFEAGDDGLCNLDDLPSMKVATHAIHVSIEKSAHDSPDSVVIQSSEQNCKTEVTTQRRRVFVNTGSAFRELGSAPQRRSTANGGAWVSKTQPDAPGAKLCRALLHRLNDLGDCAADALETYAEFSSPPWKPLDPEQHIDLIARLIGSQFAGPAAGMQLSGENLENKRRGARDFVKNGGVLRMWETHLLSNFGSDGERSAPPGAQTVVQMIKKIGTPFEVVHVDTAMGPVDFPGCPGTATKGWITWTFLATPDLSGPDVRVTQGIGYALTLHQPVLYKGRVLFVSQTDVFEDIPGIGLVGGLCSFERAKRP